MGRQTYSIARPGFIVDADSIARNTGRQVDWERVPSAYGAPGSRVIEGSTIMSLTAEGKIVPRKDLSAEVTSLSISSGTVTAAASGHGYQQGDQVTITGSADGDYDGTFEITGVSANEFEFEMEGSPEADTSGATASLAAKCILLTNAVENSKVAAINGQGVILGGVLFENLMVEHEEGDFEQWKAELKEAGTGFVFERYSDSR